MSEHFRRIGVAANEAAPADPILFEQALHSNFIGSMLVLPSDGKTLVTASEDGNISALDLETFEARVVGSHGSPVNAIACSEDGTRLVSASDDLTLRVWDPATWSVIRTLEGHTDFVSRVAVAPNGKIVSGSKDGSMRVWDLETGECLLTYSGHKQWILALTLVPGRPEVISASMDGTVKHWNIDLGDEIRTIADRGAAGVVREVKGTGLVIIPENKSGIGHTTHAHDMVVTSDGRWLVSVDKEILITDLESGAQRGNRGGHPWGLKAARLSRDGRRVFVAGDGVRVIGFDDGREVASLVGKDDTLMSLAIDPAERWICTGAKDGTVRVRDCARSLAHGPTRNHSKRVMTAAISPDGRNGASGGQDGTAGLWDLETGALREFVGLASAFVGAVEFTPDGTRLVTGTQHGDLAVWDVATASQVAAMHRKGYWINALAIVPDGRSAIAGAIGTGLTRWNLLDGGDPLVFEGKTTHVVALALTRDGTRAVTCGYVDKKPGPLQLWDVVANKLVWTANAQEGYLSCLTLLEGERVILSGSSKGAVTLWDAETGKEIRSWSGHSKFLSQVFALPGGRVASTALMTPEGARRLVASPLVLRIWNAETGELVAEHTQPGILQSKLTVVDGGRRALLRAGTGLRLWNLETGAIDATIEGLGEVSAVAVSADERSVLVGCDDGRVHVLSRKRSDVA